MNCAALWFTKSWDQAFRSGFAIGQSHVIDRSSNKNNKNQHNDSKRESYFDWTKFDVLLTLSPHASNCFRNIFSLPVWIPVAHGVVPRVLLIIFVHFETHSLVSAMLCLVLVCLFWDGGGRGAALKWWRLWALWLCWSSYRRQKSKAKQSRFGNK